ncbi:MAG: hypothetical protein RLZZ387_1292 [Chloroflexota bacterium]|jgi:uncharacterized surface protein with fasciclin (FAS1) repeats
MFSRIVRTLSVLVALALFVTAASPAAAAPKPTGNSIVDVAIAVNSSGPFAGQFDTLIAGVLAADPAVVSTLSGKGQFTVFAPTDAAFDKLGLNASNIGTALDQGTLTSILLYHVARGNRDSGDVLSSTQIRMLSGGFLKQSNGVLTDNRGRLANIIVTDVPASNGVIHAIDTVVLP